MTRARRPGRGSGRRDVVQLLVAFFPSFVESFDDLLGRRPVGSAVLVHVPEDVRHRGAVRELFELAVKVGVQAERVRASCPGWLPPRGGVVVCVFRHVLSVSEPSDNVGGAA